MSVPHIRIPPYAMSVPRSAAQPLPQPRYAMSVPHSTPPYALSVPHRAAPYAFSVPHAVLVPHTAAYAISVPD
eukprot:2658722-Rhodomonas_salina.2